jgi:hypothetical protein
MAETIEIDINAKDNTSGATKSVAANFQSLGREISGIGSSMTNIFTRPLMDLERFLMKNKDIQAALEPAKQAWTDLGNQLATSLVPVLTSLTPLMIGLADALSKMIALFSELPIGLQGAAVGFLVIVAALGPLLVFVGQLITFLGSLSAAWTTISGIIAPIASTILPGIAAAFAAVTLPVWLLLGALVLLGVTIAVFGKDAWNSLTMLWEIWKTTWEKMMKKVEDAVMSIKNVDWGGIGRNIMEGIRDGIDAGISWIVNAAKNAAQAALDAARNLLGINSPSLVFAGVGKNMMKGMASGINANAGLPASATSKAVSATIPAAVNSTSTGGGVGATLVYSPMISLASQAEAENVLLPMMRKLQRSM